MCRPVGEVGNLGSLDRRLNRIAHLGLGPPKIQWAKRDVLAHTRREQLRIGVLENQPNLLAQAGHARPVVSHWLAVKHDLATLRAQHPAEMQEQRRLAASVGAKYHHPATSRDAYRQRVQRHRAIGVRERDIARLQQRLRGYFPLPPSG